MHKLSVALVAFGVLAFVGSADAASMSRSEVRQVQRTLNDAGYDVRVDGVWGPSTRRALSDYQSKHGLTANGRLDRETMAAMNIEPSRRMSGSSGTRSRMPSGSVVPRSESPSEGGAAGINHMGSGAKGSRTKTDTLTNPNTVPRQ